MKHADRKWSWWMAGFTSCLWSGSGACTAWRFHRCNTWGISALGSCRSCKMKKNHTGMTTWLMSADHVISCDCVRGLWTDLSKKRWDGLSVHGASSPVALGSGHVVWGERAIRDGMDGCGCNGQGVWHWLADDRWWLMMAAAKLELFTRGFTVCSARVGGVSAPHSLWAVIRTQFCIVSPWGRIYHTVSVSTLPTRNTHTHTRAGMHSYAVKHVASTYYDSSRYSAVMRLNYICEWTECGRSHVNDSLRFDSLTHWK